ncbi:hypothetical protein B9G69_016135 [Bdellovibrio sp. SKB1291214]|uniref:hypothetical protein n=1 Tax=Bdellovibrio sp. SKB1291214 TaxID=1732569 RepID=UPI000B51AFF7|nr:hypothetical protein [Bdellovibrio sp. SKB1291214]UYL08574.1 hypothetical protein B9G69_016135 [Bdellovibrio sp. SKB1291214]
MLSKKNALLLLLIVVTTSIYFKKNYVLPENEPQRIHSVNGLTTHMNEHTLEKGSEPPRQSNLAESANLSEKPPSEVRSQSNTYESRKTNFLAIKKDISEVKSQDEINAAVKFATENYQFYWIKLLDLPINKILTLLSISNSDFVRVFSQNTPGTYYFSEGRKIDSPASNIIYCSISIIGNQSGTQQILENDVVGRILTLEKSFAGVEVQLSTSDKYKEKLYVNKIACYHPLESGAEALTLLDLAFNLGVRARLN